MPLLRYEHFVDCIDVLARSLMLWLGVLQLSPAGILGDDHHGQVINAVSISHSNSSPVAELVGGGGVAPSSIIPRGFGGREDDVGTKLTRHELLRPGNGEGQETLVVATGGDRGIGVEVVGPAMTVGQLWREKNRQRHMSKIDACYTKT